MTDSTRPGYQSLTAQVVERLVGGMEQGTWVSFLPGERSLAEALQVSRKTIRKALVQLQHERRIATTHGLGHRICDHRTARIKAPHLSIGLITSDAIEKLRPYTALWIDELRALLFENGIHLAIFAGQRFFSRRPQRLLQKLVDQNPKQGWVLVQSIESIQSWFAEAEIPCIVAGSCHPGVRLPNVDLDYFATCRHAAGAMMRLGHRRVAYLARQSQRAGDMESEAGFVDGVRRSSHREAHPLVVHHDGTAAGAYRTLARLFSLPRPPTALLIANPVYYLTVMSFLAERGLKVPVDVSLVSRDDDSFLDYLTPTPARYSCAPKIYAKRLMQCLLPLARGEGVAPAGHRIEPKFLNGASLGASPKAQG